MSTFFKTRVRFLRMNRISSADSGVLMATL